MAEAYAMVNNFDGALMMLVSAEQKDGETVSVNSVSRHVTLSDKVTQRTVVGMNKAAIKLCANDLIGAKEALDELLESQDLKLVTAD